MIELFKRDLFINNILLLPYCLLLRAKSFISPQAYGLAESDGWLNHIVFNGLESLPLLQNILAAILIFFQAMTINFMVNRNQITHERTAIPGMMYILFVSYSEKFLMLSPLLIGFSFLLIAIINLFDTYKRPKCSAQIFNVGFFTGLAGLFYLPLALLFVAFYIGLVIMRSFKFNERFQYLIGFLVAFYIIFAFSYYFSSHQAFFSGYIQENIGTVNIFRNLEGENLTMLVLNILLILLSLTSYNLYTMKKSIQTQKKIDILYWFLFMTIPTIYFWNDLTLIHFMLLSIPFSLFYSMNLLKMSNKLFVEMIHLMAIGVILCGHFNIWIF